MRYSFTIGKIVSIIMKIRLARFLTTVATTTLLLIMVLMANVAMEDILSAGVAALSKSDIDRYIIKSMVEEKIPGIAVVITRDNEITYAKGFGVNSLQKRSPVTPQTVFDLASCSKSFTAMAVLLLWHDGLINLDSPIRQYLPEFRLANQHAEKITVRQLLQHTSGLPGVFSEPLAFHSGEDAMQKLVAAMQKVHLNRSPGSSFEYSNLNYSLLGALVERVSGITFEEFLGQRIFTPLDMTHTTLYPDVAAQMERADGHQLMFGRVVVSNIPFYRSAAPAGWVMSTAEDMGKWLLIHLNDGQISNRQVIPVEVIKEAHTPGVSFEQNGEEIAYGMGWFIGRSPNGWPVIWHGGDTPNFVAEIILVPEHKLGVAMLVNGQTGSTIHRIATGVVSLELGQKLGLPDAPWWASWEVIDRIATGALLLSFLFLLGAIFYLWRQWRYWKRWDPGKVDSTSARRTFKLWRIIIPVTPLAILGISILSAFIVVQVIFGFNMFRVMTRFGTFAPPGVIISAVTMFGVIGFWTLVLVSTTILRIKARSRAINK